MKRFLKYLTVPVLALVASCAPQLEIEYAHEARAQPAKDGFILVEGIMPQATAVDEEIYIVGAFNGNEAAIGNASWLMTHSETITSKWTIYLDPAKCTGGTLADGFTFYSVQQGYERSSRNEPVLHTLTIGPGEWANVYADKWEKYFKPADPDEGKVVLPEHSGVRVYIIDQTGWDVIALYQWGDVNNFGGGWPGAQVAGTWTANGVEYKYFEYGDDIFGLGQNLIFNNNDNGVQLADYNVTFAEGVADYFFLVTADGVEPAPNPVDGAADPRDAMTDASPWGVIGSIASTGNSWGADEPMLTDGTWHVCLALELTASDEFKFRKDADWGVNFGGTFEALGTPFTVTQDGANIKVTEDGIYDLFLNPDAAVVVIVKAGDPVNLEGGDNPGGEEPPVEEPEPNATATIYVQDLSGWDALALYMWGDKNIAGADVCGAWPGLAPSGKTEKIGTVTYKVFEVEDAVGRAENLIFNNNGGGIQTADLALTLEAVQFIRLGDNGEGTVVATVDDPTNPDIKILVNNKTDWKEIAVYAYGDAEAFGSWPGATPVNTETVNDVDYLVFGLPAEMAGKSIKLIFNNNGGGQQLEDYAITVPEDELFLNINASYYVDDVDGNPRGADKKRVAVFVDDQTGWDAIALYQWGDVNNLGGGWPGAVVGSTLTIGEKQWKVFFFENALGLSQHLIFNNNGGGTQLADYDLKFEKNEYFLTVTAEGVTAVENPQTVVVFADDQTGWDDITLYMWGDVNNLGGGWPGVAVGGNATIGEVNAKAFVIDEALGKAENLIFNNGGNGTQLGDYALKFERNAYYLTVTASKVAVF